MTIVLSILALMHNLKLAGIHKISCCNVIRLRSVSVSIFYLQITFQEVDIWSWNCCSKKKGQWIWITKLLANNCFLLKQINLKRMSVSFNDYNRWEHPLSVGGSSLPQKLGLVPAVTKSQHSASNNASQPALSRYQALQIAIIMSQVLVMKPK